METLALRQQVIVFKRQHRRPSLTASERAVLGAAASLLVFVENSTGRGFARYRGALAPCWLPMVLAADLTSTKADW